MNTRAIKIGLAWISIVWVVCYLVVGLIPGFGATSLTQACLLLGPSFGQAG